MNFISDFKVNNKRSFLAVTIYRFGTYIHYNFKIPVLKQFLYIVYQILDLFYNKGFLGLEISPKAKIGKRLRIEHPNGIVIHGDAVIGADLTIRQQVTIGWSKSHKNGTGVPKIGNKVDIGAGAKLIGKIVIGDNVIIGANSVVTSSIPDNSTAIGIPARTI